MQRYIGTKIITAVPMNRADYNTYRGWELPSNENGADDGYLVEYTDGGKPNDLRHAGYISWSPKEQFEKAYRKTSGLTFGLAIEALKTGAKVARSGWNGKGMWLVLAGDWNARLGLVGTTLPDGWQGFLPFIAMYTADAKLVPWLASQTDVLSEDWEIIPA